MTLEWDKNKIVFQSTIEDMTSKPPRAFTIQTERFCPYCKCPKTMVFKKKLRKIMDKKISSFRFLLEFIKENNLQVFTITDLVDKIDPERHFTDGDFQRKILHILVALGYLEKDIEEYQKKDKTKGVKYIFKLKEKINPPECYDVKKDTHRDVEWLRTTIFDKKANKEIKEVGDYE